MGEHHACALDSSGKKLHAKPFPNDKQRLRARFAQLSRHGRVLVMVDQPACAAWLTSTPATPRPMPATPTSSPTLPALAAPRRHTPGSLGRDGGPRRVRRRPGG
ncbi:IS110 family transposase [Actinomadura napierensis]|uniref:IS110 family transposase n=1 Tax=Actinomadura napierensis TaxID=267854 RepID=UPI00387E323E